MLDINLWMKDFTELIKSTFGDRLEFIGLQGSRGRGEAGEHSDIDVVVILDKVEIADLEIYDKAISKLPFRELICGFLSGKQELEHWEKSDLFQFYYDTAPVYGSIDKLAGLITKEDIGKAVLTGACNIYHMCVHNILHEKNLEILKGLYKSAVFVIQADYYYRERVYIKKRAQLLTKLSGEEKRILKLFMSYSQWEAQPVDEQSKDEQSKADELKQNSEILLKWSAKLIEKYGR